MHCTYHFFRHFLKQLRPHLVGGTITDVFSQNKEELVITITSQEGSVSYLLCNIKNGFNAFSFRSEYKKAKSKFQNYFKDIKESTILDLVLIEHDRTFFFSLNDGKTLIFKMHGNRSNIILINEKKEVEQLFQNKLRGDLEFKLVDKTPSEFMDLSYLPSNAVPTLGKEVNAFFLEQGWANWTTEEKEKELTSYLEKTATQPHFLLTNDAKPALLINPYTGHKSAIEATNELYYLLSRHHSFILPKKQALTETDKQIKQTNTYIKKVNQQLEKFMAEPSYKERADVLMANLHLLTESNKPYLVHNFYNGTELSITLKTNEKPQDLASKWYKKDKNRHLEKNKISENKANKLRLLETLHTKKEKLEACTSGKELHKLLNTTTNSLKKVVSQFKETSLNGFKIYIGRNSKNNDELLKFAKKDDIWLHAKDVPGSHVIIKTNNNHLPHFVLEYAASLAGYYSKRKTDSICPVIYTPKKYVRKKKGLLPGQVIVERENVLLVKPQSLHED